MRGNSGYLHGSRRGGKTDELLMEANDRASAEYPSVLIDGHLLHVFKQGDWSVWINCEDMDFTGLCIGSGKTRDEAVGQAVQALEAITEKLQGPLW